MTLLLFFRSAPPAGGQIQPSINWSTSGIMSIDLDVFSANVRPSINWSTSGIMSIAVTVTRSRQRRPRREYIWMTNPAAVRSGVIT